MTKQSEILNSDHYVSVLDHGFVGIAQEEGPTGNLYPSILGNDKSITRSARMSYGKGTKSINDDTILLRYLLRHKHTTPFEMAEIKFHAKMPIFVARQWVRHRTASINEYSGRYSEMPDEFYIPEFDYMMPQSTSNKQGRGGEMKDEHKKQIEEIMNTQYDGVFYAYEALLGNKKEEFKDDPWIDDEGNELGPVCAWGDPEFPGLTRELSRTVLPLSNYTEWYWKANLWNTFRFLSLRMDPHAQYEVRIFAESMYELLKPHFPIALQAFEDYMLKAIELSRMEKDLVKDMMTTTVVGNKTLFELYVAQREEELIKKYGLTKREWTEFKAKFDLDK